MAFQMELIACRECATEVDPRLANCPHCQAPRPARRDWAGEGYEWKSAWQWMGGPVVHIAFGNGRDGRPRIARGVIAIGQRAVGGVAIGIIATGFVSVGVVALGIFSLGIVAVGAVLALGVNAIAPVAMGVAAVGYIAGGVAPVGWKILFSATR